jgi:type IV secretion system protein VirD4
MKFDKKLIIQTVPYIFIFIIALQVIPQIPFEMPISDVLIALIATAIIKIVVYVKGKNAKKYRKGIEYGSARWGNEKDIQPYIDPVFENNVILSQTERLTMNSRPKNPAHARNKNVLVIGGSGSGKTRFFVKPNLLQMHSSYVVTDPNVLVL